MAKAKVVGNVVLITSRYSLEEIRLVERYKPEALKLTEEGKGDIFAICTTKKEGSVSPYGISFGREDFSEPSHAIIDCALPKSVTTRTEVEEFVENTFGKTLFNLVRVEKQIEDALEAVAAIRAEIASNIQIENTMEGNDND